MSQAFIKKIAAFLPRKEKVREGRKKREKKGGRRKKKKKTVTASTLNLSSLRFKHRP